MKISIDLRFAHLPGGSWPYVSQLAYICTREHPQDRWRFYYNPWSEPQKEIVQTLHANHPDASKNRSIQYVPVRSACLSIKQHIEFLRFRDNSDVYHYPHFDMPLGIRRLPLVLTIHDLFPLVVPDYCSALKKAYFRRLTRHNARRAARVITVSQNTKNDLVHHLNIDPEKITVIHQGYSQAFRPIENLEILEPLAKKYKLPKSFLLYTGNHKPHKNLKRLLQAYSLIGQSVHKEFPLVLTGPITADSRRLQELAEKLHISKHVRFLGHILADELPILYNLCSLVVLPSLYEGFGLAPLEAMACGRPAVASNVSATPEVVASAARMFNPYDIEEIASTIKTALENDIDNPQVRRRGFEQAAKFSWDKNAQLTWQIYQQIAASVKKLSIDHPSG